MDDGCFGGGHPRLAMVVVNLIPLCIGVTFNDADARGEHSAVGCVTNHVDIVAHRTAIDLRAACAAEIYRHEVCAAAGCGAGGNREPGQVRVFKLVLWWSSACLVVFTIPDFVHR